MNEKVEKKKIIGYPILSLEHLEKLCKGKQELDCYVRLNAGRSSKHLIFQEDGGVTVINEIDDTCEDFDSLIDMIFHHSTIAKAMGRNAFFVYAYELKGDLNE